MLVRTVKCLEGEVEVELICEPAFDYGRTPAEWTLVQDSRHTADATGAGLTIRLQTDLELGIEANRVRARHTLRTGRGGILPRSSGARRSRSPPTSMTPTSDSGPPSGSGDTGSAGRARSPTIAGARRSSVRR